MTFVRSADTSLQYSLVERDPETVFQVRGLMQTDLWLRPTNNKRLQAELVKPSARWLTDDYGLMELVFIIGIVHMVVLAEC
jgi:hypothetical protein